MGAMLLHPFGIGSPDLWHALLMGVLTFRSGGRVSSWEPLLWLEAVTTPSRTDTWTPSWVPATRLPKRCSHRLQRNVVKSHFIDAVPP